MDAPAPPAGACTVCVVALGTRGDVQPLACLALQLQRAPAPHGLEVSFITHAAHSAWLGSGMFAQLASRELLDSPPAGGDWARPPAAAANAANAATAAAPLPPPSLAAPDSSVAAALRRLLAPPPHAESHAGGSQHSSHQPTARALIVFNLFALEAYHVAEAMRVPCAAAAPYQVPYSCPAAFAAMFRAELPELHDALTAAAAAPPVAAAAHSAVAAAPATRGSVTFAEVTHWMWPLFTERWGDWRSSQLRLPPLPLHDAATEEPLPRDRLPPAPPLLYGFSELLVPRPAFWPRSVVTCGFWQPPLEWFEGQHLPEQVLRLVASLPLLYPGSPPGGTERPARRLVCVDFGSMGRLGLIPDPAFTLQVLIGAARAVGMSVLILSAGWAPLEAAAAQLRTAAQPPREPAGSGAPPAVAPLGPGAPQAPAAEPAAFVPAQAAVDSLLAEDSYTAADGARPPHAKRRRSHGLRPEEPGAAGGTRGPGDGPHVGPASGTVCGRQDPPDPPGGLHLHAGDVPHQLLLPHCALVLHHGGSGTTAAALQCGTPQVTCPLMHDQPFWAERLSYLELSPPPLPRHVLFGRARRDAGPGGGSGNEATSAAAAAVAAAFHAALTPARQAAARSIAQELARERGLQAACDVLLGLLGNGSG